MLFRSVGRDEAVFGAELNNETARLLLKGLQASTLPDKVGEYLSQFVAENMSAADIGTAIAKSLNGAIMALGANLIAAGLYVMAGATLALFVPGLAAMFPPIAIPIAAGAIALGTAMVAGSSYLGSLMSGGNPKGGAGSKGGVPSAGGSTGRASGGRPSASTSGFQSDSSAAPPVQIVENYNFNGPMGGSPRRLARSIADLAAEQDTIGPRRRR